MPTHKSRSPINVALPILACTILLAACGTPGSLPTKTTESSLTETVSPVLPVEASVRESIAAEATPTTAPLPVAFTSELLRPGIEAVPYLGDACGYMAARWDPQGALPGTVVAPIMFHGIVPGSETPSAAQDINYDVFEAIIQLAKELGFETITSEQLLGFLLRNEKIPARSMIMILDDRKAGTAEDYFLPVLEENDWTLTLAWIAQSDTDIRPGKLAGETLWEQMERLNETGFFDIQSHGRDHVYITASTTQDAIHLEIEGSLPPLKEHFGITPLAYIWPGGNFTAFAMQVAHEAGFELGFIERSYGPLLFNWVPLSERERALNDPLLLLPRFWDTAALLNLEQTAQIGDAARLFAQENYAAEAAWFSQNCGGELPPLDEVFK